MIALLFSLIGCTIQYAYAEPPTTSVVVEPAPVVTTYYVTSPQYRRWVPGHYNPRGIWVSGYWTYAPTSRPPVYVQSQNCHVHRDGRSHCGRH